MWLVEKVSTPLLVELPVFIVLGSSLQDYRQLFQLGAFLIPYPINVGNAYSKKLFGRYKEDHILLW
ncbi:MAG TPA: hypothetical protein VNS32_18850 [Flavisolibacter sp.]|nr:hypothetical protein [Flavisolibacter sp.]